MSSSALVQHIQAVILGLANQLVGGSGKTDVGHRDDTVIVTLHKSPRHESGEEWYQVELYIRGTQTRNRSDDNEILDYLRSLAFAVLDPSLGAERAIRPEHMVRVYEEPDKRRFCATWKVPA